MDVKEVEEGHLSLSQRKMYLQFLPHVSLSRVAGFIAAWAVAIGIFSVGARAQNGTLSVELNKLEASDKNCRAYLVINNTTDVTYDAMKLDLVMFQPDGIIGKRFVLDLAPLRSQKKTVKLFNLEDTACDKVGSLLVNEVVDCKSGGEVLADCLSRLTLTSLASVAISK